MVLCIKKEILDSDIFDSDNARTNDGLEENIENLITTYNNIEIRSNLDKYLEDIINTESEFERIDFQNTM